MPRRPAQLILARGTASEQVFPFVSEIEVGRRSAPEGSAITRVVLADPVVSSRHCIITQIDSGRFFIRDVSLNGTRVDGKRLVPNVEFALEPGQTVQVGDYLLTLWAASTDDPTTFGTSEHTMLVPGLLTVTVIVGDIRGYTALSQTANSADVHRSVRNVFSALESVVWRHGGTLKEYQGDAIFAFWEEKPDGRGMQAIEACSAALALRDEAQRLANDSSLWLFPDFPLALDWALATGSVTLASMGGHRPTGLSMVGDVVNLAFRLEKLADGTEFSIIACHNTYALARERFDFVDLGEVTVKGRTGSERIYALRGPLPVQPASDTPALGSEYPGP
jgi:adenylate cyclase